MERIENRTFDEIKLGDTASLVRTLTHKDIELFAVMSGDINPTHLDDAFAKSDMFHKVVAHGMWSGALISTVLGTQLPGPGTIYVDQSLHFREPIGLGDTITVTVKVRDKIEGNAPGHFRLPGRQSKGEEVITGTAEVIAPTEKISRPRVVLPEVELRQEGATLRTPDQDDPRSRSDPHRGCPPGRHAVAAWRRGGRPHQTDHAGAGWAGSQDPRRRRAGAARSGALRDRVDGAQRGRGGSSRRHGPRRQGRGADEGRAPYR